MTSIVTPSEELRRIAGLARTGRLDEAADAVAADPRDPTACYAQVTEAVYTRSAGRWRRYEKHLEPVLDILRPWVDRFGYSLDDDRVPAWDGAPGVVVDPV
jgi:hypothetical protein